MNPKIGLSISIAAQIAAFYTVLKYWPNGYGLVALLLLLLVLTPLMFVFCLDTVRFYNAKSEKDTSSILARMFFSLPVIALALLALLVGIALAIAFGFMLFSERFAQAILSLPEILAVLAMFIFFGIGLFRVVFSRKNDNFLP